MFDAKTVLRRGYVWSPILFGLVINYVLANSVKGGIDIRLYVVDLDFADDIALLDVFDLVTVGSEERSVVDDLMSTANNRSSAVADGKSSVC